MSVGLSNPVKNAMLNQIRDLIDAGGSSGSIRIYSGARPSTGAPPVGGTNVLLAEIDFNLPSASNANNGILTFDVTGMSTTGIAAGTAVWARIRASDDAHIVDLDVGNNESEEPVRLSSTTISLGGAVTIQVMVINFND